MMINSLVPLGYWGEAVNTAVFLHKGSTNEDLTTRADHDGSQISYRTPYDMLHTFGKPSHDKDGNKMSYKAPLQQL